ncbi:MAG TPA: hypothetical protein DCR14_06760 [Acidimicrobiaceae bacterium]|nr:hypothetical protein [Acidimicrobiaceae bacterium]
MVGVTEPELSRDEIVAQFGVPEQFRWIAETRVMRVVLWNGVHIWQVADGRALVDTAQAGWQRQLLSVVASRLSAIDYFGVGMGVSQFVSPSFVEPGFHVLRVGYVGAVIVDDEGLVYVHSSVPGGPASEDQWPLPPQLSSLPAVQLAASRGWQLDYSAFTYAVMWQQGHAWGSLTFHHPRRPATPAEALSQLCNGFEQSVVGGTTIWSCDAAGATFTIWSDDEDPDGWTLTAALNGTAEMPWLFLGERSPESG